MACDPQLQQNLADAKTAYHNLTTGKLPRVVVDQNGERVEFVAANRASLYNYVSELQAKVDACSSVAGGFYPTNGPAQFLF